MTPAHLRKIFDKWKPEGWEIKFNRDMTKAACYKDRLLIVCPRPTNPMALLFAVHEFAHAILDPWKRPVASPLIEEFQAEVLALAILDLEGVPVDAAMMHECRRNVRKYALPGIRVPEHVARFIA